MRGSSRRPRSDPLETGVGVFFGWCVVAFAFVLAFFAWGIGFYGPSIFLRTITEERGWSVSAVSSAITVHFLLGALIVATVPELHRRFGLVVVTRVGLVLLAIGPIGWAVAQHPWQLVPAALITGAGWALTSGAAVNAIVSPWFDRRRPAALGMALNGASTGGILLAPVWLLLIDRVSFPTATVLVAVTIAIVLLPIVGRFAGVTPETAGVGVDGEPVRTDPVIRPPGSPISRRALMRDRRFLTISGAFALGLFAQVGVITVLVTVVAARFGAGWGAGAVTIATVSAIAGRTLLGAVIGDRDRRIAASVNFGLQACGVLLLVPSSVPLAMQIFGIILFGLGLGNLTSLPPLIAQSEFVRIDVPRVVALTIAVNQIVYSFAPATFGALADRSGGYAVPLALAVGVQTLAAAVVLVGLGRPELAIRPVRK